MDTQRKGYEWWDRLCNLPKFSFIIKADGVRRVEDSMGNWIEYASAQAVIDDAQAEINILRERLHRLAPAAAPQPATAPTELERFEAWWQAKGQFCRAGGGEYEKTFAYRAFQAALAPSPGVDTPEQKPCATLHDDGHWTWTGTPPYEARFAGWRMPVCAAPSPRASAESEPAQRITFPTHLRKMWSGSEVQAWLDARTGAEPAPPTARGSLARKRRWRAEQAAPGGSAGDDVGPGNEEAPK